MKDAQKKEKLTPEEIALLCEYTQAIENLSQQKQGALKMIVSGRRLQGTWALIGDELVKQEALAA
jgi:hypothetical protein